MVGRSFGPKLHCVKMNSSILVSLERKLSSKSAEQQRGAVISAGYLLSPGGGGN